jgi:Ca-activated chloride channel family protein
LNKAVLFYRKATMLAPFQLDFLNKYATALSVTGNNKDAKLVYERILAENPKNHTALCNLGFLYLSVENNAGYLSPMKAAELAAAFGIRVYTVGIGSDGIVMSPEGQNPDGSYYFAPRMMHFDTELLEEIAAKTNGRFYRAQSAEDLAGIYAEIDHLEKTKVEIKTLQRTHDYYQWPLLAGLVLFLLEFFIVRIWMRSMNDH